MAAIKKEIVTIAVTGGDAIPSNRLSGKSNTGTYFICSSKNWSEFENFFDVDSFFTYQLDLKRIAAYKETFLKLFADKKDLYPDSMRHFEGICDSLLMYGNNPSVQFALRINDSRYFLKFVNNNNEVEYALRGIIYSDLTNLVFDNHSRTFYLEVNFNQFENPVDCKEVFYDRYD